MKDFILFIAPFTLMILFPIGMYLLVDWAQKSEEERQAKVWKRRYIWKELQSIENSPDYMMLCIKFLCLLESKHTLEDLEEFFKKVKTAQRLYERSLFEKLLKDLDSKKSQQKIDEAMEKPVKKTIKISDLLGLGNDFSQTELKRAYRSWMMKNHPDKNPKVNLETVQKVTAWYNRNKI